MNAVVNEQVEKPTPFELSQELEIADLYERYRTHQRVRVADVLAGSGALQLHRHLSGAFQWNTFVVAAETVYSGESDSDTLSAALDGAQKGFACVFDANRLFAEDVPDGVTLAARPDTALLTQLHTFVNSNEFIGLCREVTGLSAIQRAAVRATQYRQGHFSLFHGQLPYDARKGRRLIEFELNLTIEWKPEWGGLRHFKLARDYASEAYTPSFNVLDLFSPVKGRWVSPVAPYAGQSRLAVGGWLYGP